MVWAEDGVCFDASAAGLGERDRQAPLVVGVTGAAQEAAPLEVFDQHRGGAFGQGQVSSERGQRNAAGGGHVVEQLQLVLGQVSLVWPVERQPQAAIGSLESFGVGIVHKRNEYCYAVRAMIDDALLLDTWAISDRITLYLLDAVPAEALTGVGASGGRTVGAMFAHLHNTRLLWLKAAAPDLLAHTAKLEPADTADSAALRVSLEASGHGVADLLARGLAAGRVKNFKPHPVAFLGYLIAHDAHHRGEIQLTLTQAGHKLDDKIGYGLWEWGVR